MGRKSSRIPIHIKLLEINYTTRTYLVYYPDLFYWRIIPFREVKDFSPLKKNFWRCQNMTLEKILGQEKKKAGIPASKEEES